MPPLNISGVVSPQPVDVTEVAPATASAAAAVAKAQEVVPQQINLSAYKMSPTVFVGFKLAKMVLGITAGSIVLLLLYLFAMEWIIGNDVRHAYQKVLSPSRVGAQFHSAAQLEEFSADLSDARKNSAAQWTSGSLQNAEDVLKLIDELPSVTADQRSQLRNCVPPPPPSDAARDKKLDSCLEIAGGVKQAALEAVAAATDGKVAADSAGKIGEQRQSLHTFWVQAAQLVLLNLLLPLLTALFGYIFGTQQAQKTS